MVMKLAIGKLILFCLLAFVLTACNTVYEERQSETLSKVVYATKDSLDAARVDLADEYATEATRIVKPPKNRIQIQVLYKKPNPSSKTEIKQRVVVIPAKYKDDVVVVVSTAEYEELLKNKELYDALQIDHEILKTAKKQVDEELIKQAEYKNKMIQDLKDMQITIAEKSLALYKCRLIIFGLMAAIVSGIYLRIKGIL